MDREQKLKNIKAAQEKIDKDFGKNSVMRLDEKPDTKLKVISTGSIRLDRALGVGGLPKGRMVEIYGPESSGKTTLAIHIIAEAQKAGGLAAIIDAEHAFDMKYAEDLGVNTSELYISQPDYGEQGLEIADRLISTGSFDVIVIDSVAALVPKAELEGEMGESKMGLHARLMSQALRKLTATISKTQTLVIFINQLREKIGVMFGNPETTTGGNGLKFYASVRLDVRRSLTAANAVMDGEVKVGNSTTVKVIKNKVAPPFKIAEFDIIYGQGIDKLGELLEVSVELGIINKSGSYYSYNGDKLGQGKTSIIELLQSNLEFRNEVAQRVREQIHGKKDVPVDVQPEDSSKR